MSSAPQIIRRSLLLLALLQGLIAPAGATQPTGAHWVGTWATAPLSEPAIKEHLPLVGATLRQVVHASIGGNRLQVRFTNVFGTGPLELRGAHLAQAGPQGSIQTETDRTLRFNGDAAVTIPAGATVTSDPVDFALAPLADLAISVCLKEVPATLTLHPGSRTTSYLLPGDALSAAALPEATKIEHWYFIAGVDVVAEAPASAAIVILGDSIADGRGSTTDQNNRWPDELARRLQARADTAHLGILNGGIGGNRLLRDGLGPNALARFDRDVLHQTAASWVIVHMGINDIGTRIEARKHGAAFASAADIIAADEQLIARAHAHGLRIYGATITPYQGADFYWSADGEADRQAVNDWIRTSGRFDAVIDFDAALRNPREPTRLAPAFDCGDHLHPSPAGYAEMARAVDLKLFSQPTEAGRTPQSLSR